MEDRVLGRVKWYNSEKGWGFVVGPDGKDSFVHHSQVLGGGTDQTLKEGQIVEYTERETAKGLQAICVVVQRPLGV